MKRMEISLAEWLALGLFCLSALRSAIDLVAIPRWFDLLKGDVSGVELNKLVAKKRRFENVTAKAFTVGLAIVTGMSLMFSFSTAEVEVSDVVAIQKELNRLEIRLAKLELEGSEVQDE